VHYTPVSPPPSRNIEARRSVPSRRPRRQTHARSNRLPRNVHSPLRRYGPQGHVRGRDARTETSITAADMAVQCCVRTGSPSLKAHCISLTTKARDIPVSDVCQSPHHKEPDGCCEPFCPVSVHLAVVATNLAVGEYASESRSIWRSLRLCNAAAACHSPSRYLAATTRDGSSCRRTVGGPWAAGTAGRPPTRAASGNRVLGHGVHFIVRVVAVSIRGW
jgi:hypothetical protein